MVVKSPKSVVRESPSTKTMVIIILLFAFVVFLAGLFLLALAWRYRSSRPDATKLDTNPPKVIVITSEGGAAGDPPVYPRKSPDYPLRNAPRDYQQVGVLVDSADGGEPTLLALFGRKMQTRDRWEYYAASDKFHMWKLPVQVQKRMCDHEFGCDEIYNGDQVIVPDYGNRTFTARMYAYAPPDGSSHL